MRSLYHPPILLVYDPTYPPSPFPSPSLPSPHSTSPFQRLQPSTPSKLPFPCRETASILPPEYSSHTSLFPPSHPFQLLQTRPLTSETSALPPESLHLVVHTEALPNSLDLASTHITTTTCACWVYSRGSWLLNFHLGAHSHAALSASRPAAK